MQSFDEAPWSAESWLHGKGCLFPRAWSDHARLVVSKSVIRGLTWILSTIQQFDGGRGEGRSRGCWLALLRHVVAHIRPMLLHPRPLPAACASTPLQVNPPPSRVTIVNTVECLDVGIACLMPWLVAGCCREDEARNGIMTISVGRNERIECQSWRG